MNVVQTIYVFIKYKLRYYLLNINGLLNKYVTLICKFQFTMYIYRVCTSVRNFNKYTLNVCMNLPYKQIQIVTNIQI